MLTADLDFFLPPELIAQYPPAERTASRLLHYTRSTGQIAHRTFADLPSLLRPGDLLVFNDTRVLPARFLLRKPTGGLVEGLFLSEPAPGQWRTLLKNPGPATHFTFANDDTLQVSIERKLTEGEHLIRVFSPAAGNPPPATELLFRFGRMPLPPYIRRDKRNDPRDPQDLDRYQTTYATAPPASVAAPTAGLHFDPALLADLTAQGVLQTAITLEVGMGTFKPVASDTLEAHSMHTERYDITTDAADAINAAQRENRRVVSVGTTTARVLESQPPGAITPQSSDTAIFIRPPYRWTRIDALITNFHLPRSTLIALVAAFTGLEAQRHIYEEAIRERYRFFSYGDSSFLE